MYNFLLAIFLFTGLQSCIRPSGEAELYRASELEKIKYATWKANQVDKAHADTVLMSSHPENIDFEKNRMAIAKEIDADSIKLGWKEAMFRR